jgi:hypothetical protein
MTLLDGTTKRWVGWYGQTATLHQYSDSGNTDAWDDPEWNRTTTDIDVADATIASSVSSDDLQADSQGKWRDSDKQMVTDYDGSITEVGEGDQKRNDRLVYDGETYAVLVDFEFQGVRHLGLIEQTVENDS